MRHPRAPIYGEAMAWRIAADSVLVVHLAFVVFVVAGGLLAWRWRRVVRVHLAAAAYGVVILVAGFTCPLTPLENALRRRAGQAGYDGGFVERYVVGVLYPGEPPGSVGVLLLVGLIAVNTTLYAVVLRRRARVRSAASVGVGTS